MFPLHQIAHVGVSQSKGLKLFGREVILEEFQPISSRYLIVTDGQTDRQTDGQTKAISIPRYALVHRAVKTEDYRNDSVYLKLLLNKVSCFLLNTESIQSFCHGHSRVLLTVQWCSWKFCTVVVKKLSLLFYNDNITLTECFYKLNSFLHKFV